MQELHKRGGSGLADFYAKVNSHFPPVMRHFFTERYTSPALWCALLRQATHDDP